MQRVDKNFGQSQRAVNIESVRLMNMEVISLKRPWPSRLENVYDDNNEVNGALMVKFPKSKVRFIFLRVGCRRHEWKENDVTEVRHGISAPKGAKFGSFHSQ